MLIKPCFRCKYFSTHHTEYPCNSCIHIQDDLRDHFELIQEEDTIDSCEYCIYADELDTAPCNQCSCIGNSEQSLWEGWDD